jgi:hypothetical protein
MLVHAFEDNLVTIGRHVEIANVEVGSEIGQPPFDARFHIDGPEILVLNVSPQK